MCRTKRRNDLGTKQSSTVYSKRETAADERMERRRGWRGKGIDPHGRSRVERRAI